MYRLLRLISRAYEGCNIPYIPYCLIAISFDKKSQHIMTTCSSFLMNMIRHISFLSFFLVFLRALYPRRIGIWNCWFLWGERNRRTPQKAFGARRESATNSTHICQWRHLLLLICQPKNYWLVKQRVHSLNDLSIFKCLNIFKEIYRTGIKPGHISGWRTLSPLSHPNLKEFKLD